MNASRTHLQRGHRHLCLQRGSGFGSGSGYIRSRPPPPGELGGGGGGGGGGRLGGINVSRGLCVSRGLPISRGLCIYNGAAVTRVSCNSFPTTYPSSSSSSSHKQSSYKQSRNYMTYSSSYKQLQTHNGIYNTIYNTQRRSISTPVELLTAVPSAIQAAIAAFHTASGLEWWTTFTVSTLFLRASLFPLVYSQIVISKRMAKATPELKYLVQLLRARLKGIKYNDYQEIKKVFSIFTMGVTSCLTVHGVSVWRMVAYPALNITVFITFVYSFRDMLANSLAEQDMEHGGLFWFVDLTTKDPTFLLPLAAISLSYLALDLGFKTKNPGRLIVLVQDGVQSMMLLGIPLISGLPAGVFFYWIPSSLFSISQTALVRSDRFQRLVGISSKPR